MFITHKIFKSFNVQKLLSGKFELKFELNGVIKIKKVHPLGSINVLSNCHKNLTLRL